MKKITVIAVFALLAITAMAQRVSIQTGKKASAREHML